MQAAIIFDRFGPYHASRIKAAANYLSIIPIELFGETGEYDWDKMDAIEGQITLFKNHTGNHIAPALLHARLQQTLSKHQPDVVAINGWSHKGALSALYWCLQNKVPAILMSESSYADEKRVAGKEWLKQQVVKQFAAALVGGSRHYGYLKKLGMNENAIATGYDVIDTAYFKKSVQQIRKHEADARHHLKLPKYYFLASSRFVSKKNLFRLITAFAAYRRQTTARPFDLVILGDGPLRNNLERLIDALGVTDAVQLPGFKQYHELPYYYAFARAFIHASTCEQWGLVVNEAMAAGLPVFVSERCGCVPELVKEGVNGFSFNPFESAALSGLMQAIGEGAYDLEQMGRYSETIISHWQPDRFGKGLQMAVTQALLATQKHFRIIDQTLLKLLIYR